MVPEVGTGPLHSLLSPLTYMTLTCREMRPKVSYSSHSYHQLPFIPTCVSNLSYSLSKFILSNCIFSVMTYPLLLQRKTHQHHPRLKCEDSLLGATRTGKNKQTICFLIFIDFFKVLKINSPNKTVTATSKLKTFAVHDPIRLLYFIIFHYCCCSRCFTIT